MYTKTISSSSTSSRPPTVVGSPPSLPPFAYPPTAVFGAHIENVRLFGPLLRAVHIRDWAVLAFSSRGIRATASDAAGSVQATAYIPKDVFPSFQYRPQTSPDLADDKATTNLEMDITLDLPILLHVLNLYNSATVHPSVGSFPSSLEAHAAAAAAGISAAAGSHGLPSHSSVAGVTKLCFWCMDPDSSPLEVCIEEAGAITTASIDTFSPPDNAHLNLQQDWESAGPHVYKVILASSLLRDALTRLGIREPTSTNVSRSSTRTQTNQAADTMFSTSGERMVRLTLVPDQGLILSTRGPVGYATVMINSTSMDIFQSPSVKLTTKYPAAALDLIIRALGLAQQVSIRANEIGILNIQALVAVRTGVNCFIEFVISPLDIDTDDEGINGECDTE